MAGNLGAEGYLIFTKSLKGDALHGALRHVREPPRTALHAIQQLSLRASYASHLVFAEQTAIAMQRC